LISILSLAMCYLISDVHGIKDGAETDKMFTTRKTCWTVNSFFSSMFRYGCLGLWRVGEVATRMSVFVAFASIVDAKWGTFGITSTMLIINLILQWAYDDIIKATIFYNGKVDRDTSGKPKEWEMYVAEGFSSGTEDTFPRASRDTKLTETYSLPEYKAPEPSLSDGEVILVDWQTSQTRFSKIDSELKQSHYLNERYHQGESTFKRFRKLFTVMLPKILSIVFIIINWVGAGIFALLALPSLSPPSYVGMYYALKVITECFLIGCCIYETRSMYGHTNFYNILRYKIFKGIWFYWIIGVIGCFTGCLISYVYVLDVRKWTKSVQPDDASLHKMMKEGKYAFVDRAIGNKTCTLTDIIQRTLHQRGAYLSSQECSWLLREMLRHGIVELGPKNGKFKPGKSNSSKNENNIVSVLLRNFDETPSRTHCSKLAKLVFKDLRSTLHYSYKDFWDAGVPLTFLRFHLDVSENYFNKNGPFDCTADELFRRKFDLLFCTNRGFTVKELVDAGFKKCHVNSVCKYCKLEDLESFGSELFQMNFYIQQLRDCKSFKDEELRDWYKDYRLNLEDSEHYTLRIPSDNEKPENKPVKRVRLNPFASRKRTKKLKCMREFL